MQKSKSKHRFWQLYLGNWCHLYHAVLPYYCFNIRQKHLVSNECWQFEVMRISSWPLRMFVNALWIQSATLCFWFWAIYAESYVSISKKCNILFPLRRKNIFYSQKSGDFCVVRFLDRRASIPFLLFYLRWKNHSNHLLHKLSSFEAQNTIIFILLFCFFFFSKIEGNKRKQTTLSTELFFPTLSSCWLIASAIIFETCKFSLTYLVCYVYVYVYVRVCLFFITPMLCMIR